MIYLESTQGAEFNDTHVALPSGQFRAFLKKWAWLVNGWAELDVRGMVGLLPLSTIGCNPSLIFMGLPPS